MMGKVLVTHQTGPEGKKVKNYILRKPQKFQKNFIVLLSRQRDIKNCIY